jgi:uncharacterized protein (TIGR03437 family)
MGPDIFFPESSDFPLPVDLEGTSVSATVGGVTVDCPMIFASERQVGAILPSTIPVGHGTLTVTYNGQSSDPLPIEVVPHAFGIFSVRQSGAGPGVFTDPFTDVANTIVTSSNPGQTMDIWGTGLGAVVGDEALLPLPDDMVGLDVRVIVGDIPAEVIYRGRSGCCAGVDQIRFIVPPGVSGCYVPVRVFVEDVRSNDVTMSIAGSGPYCESPGGPTAADLLTAVETGNLRHGVISLSRSRIPEASTGRRSDHVQADFRNHRLSELLQFGLQFSAPRVGSCSLSQSFIEPIIIDLTPLSIIDPGPITMSGSAGVFQMNRHDAFGFPTGFNSLTFIPDYPEGPESIIRDGTVLASGTYTFSAAGSIYDGPLQIAKLNPFSVSLILPALLDWTNQEALAEIDRGRPLTIAWANGVPGAWVNISGTSMYEIASGGSRTLTFGCWTDAAAGTFTVPSEIVRALPASGQPDPFMTNSVRIAQWVFEDRFSVPGLDVGRLVSVDSIQIPTVFH